MTIPSIGRSISTSPTARKALTLLLPRCSLSRTEPNASYSLSVKAFTSKHEGRYSASAELRTQPAPPDAPTLLHAACEPDEALRLWWQRPSLSESRSVRYLLQSRASDSEPFAELEVPAKEGQVRHQACGRDGRAPWAGHRTGGVLPVRERRWLGVPPFVTSPLCFICPVLTLGFFPMPGAELSPEF